MSAVQIILALLQLEPAAAAAITDIVTRLRAQGLQHATEADVQAALAQLDADVQAYLNARPPPTA